MLDGIARELCPNMDIVEKVTPYAQRLLGNRLSPERISEDLLRVIQHAQVALQDVPIHLSQLMSDVEGGNLKIRSTVEELSDVVSSIQRSGIRLSIAILSASLGVSGAILIAPNIGAVEDQNLALFLGAGLGILSFGMFMGLSLHVAVAARMHPREIRRQVMGIIRFFTRRSG